MVVLGVAELAGRLLLLLLSVSDFLGFLFTGSPLSLGRWSELDPDLLDSRASFAPLTAPLADIVDM